MFQKLLSKLPESFQVFAERFSRGPLVTPDDLAGFIHSRSAYVGQTALYGYLKTRMGTRFRQLFEDDVFSVAIHGAAINLYGSCAADLTVYCVARIAREGDYTDENLARLATLLYGDAMKAAYEDIEDADVPEASLDAFSDRIKGISWRDEATELQAFEGSIGDLLRFAPVIDEFKELDKEIVMNSIRLRWRDIKEQVKKRLDLAAFQATL